METEKHSWRSKDDLGIDSLGPCGSWDQTQAVRLDGEHLYCLHYISAAQCVVPFFFPDILFYVYERVVYLYICMCAVHRSEEGVGVKDDCESPCQC